MDHFSGCLVEAEDQMKNKEVVDRQQPFLGDADSRYRLFVEFARAQICNHRYICKASACVVQELNSV